MTSSSSFSSLSASLSSSTSSDPPHFLEPLLAATSSLPIYPLAVHSHSKAIHPSLTSLIADGAFHPALEAALHLANGDLYSAHFLVRKGQGGRRELDWEHGILHRFEGDWGNAKCWYTDVFALSSSSSIDQDSSPPLPLFTTFWTTNTHSTSPDLPSLGEILSHPSQYLDLLHLYSLLSSSDSPQLSVSSQTALAKKIHATSLYASKLTDVPHFSQHDLEQILSQPEGERILSRSQIEDFARNEIRSLVIGCGERYGWKGGMSMQESVDAFEAQKGNGVEEGGVERVDHQAQGMILGAGGNRKF